MQLSFIMLILSSCLASSDVAPTGRDESYSAMCKQTAFELVVSQGDSRIHLIETFAAGVDVPVAALDLLECALEGCQDECVFGTRSVFNASP